MSREEFIKSYVLSKMLALSSDGNLRTAPALSSLASGYAHEADRLYNITLKSID